MGDRAVGDEDGGASADGEGDDGAVFGDEGAEKRLDLKRGSAEPLEIGEYGDGRRAWWEIGGASEVGKNGVQKGTETERNDDDEPRLHDSLCFCSAFFALFNP